MSIAGCKTLRYVLHALVLPCLFFASVAATAQEVIADPPSRVARLAHIEGEVSMAPAGTEEWAEAVLNRPVTSGDRLWTEGGARVELQAGSAAAYLSEQTSFSFVELDEDVMQMSLTDGAMTLRVRRLADKETIQIETPNVAIALREPGEYHIEVDAESDRTIVKTRHGKAEVFGGEQTHLVRADEQAVFSGLEQLTAQTRALAPRTEFESWANDREGRESQSRSAQYVSRDIVGYEDLDEHGDWHHEAEYGYVWRPRYVVNDWAPYRDGRWVWVSPWGWTWVDRARWGFAPFHYGRWAHVRDRWCWVPGPRHYRPVYAPALVGWVGGPHVNVSVSIGRGIGWFPLGPREVYIPGYRHSPRYIRHVNVSNTIIVNNTYITNVYAGRHRNIDYRYSRHPRAVTAIDRGQFVGGRPVMGRLMSVNERQLREWRQQPRPPALSPDRASVLAGSARRAPPIIRPVRGSEREPRSARLATNRIDFDTERRRIEANGGQPIPRTRLYRGNPKEGSEQLRSFAGSDAARANRSAAARRSDEGQQLQTAPARERTRTLETNPSANSSVNSRHGAVRENPRRSENRSSDVAGSALRGSERTPTERSNVDRSRGNSTFATPYRNDARNAERETRRAAPRTQIDAPPVNSSPPPSNAPRSNVWRSAERTSPSSTPPRTESRSAPPSAPARAEPRSQPRAEPRSNRSEGNTSGRSQGTNSRFQQR
jgi:hypothetical protein